MFIFASIINLALAEQPEDFPIKTEEEFFNFWQIKIRPLPKNIGEILREPSVTVVVIETAVGADGKVSDLRLISITPGHIEAKPIFDAVHGQVYESKYPNPQPMRYIQKITFRPPATRLK